MNVTKFGKLTLAPEIFPSQLTEELHLIGTQKETLQRVRISPRHRESQKEENGQDSIDIVNKNSNLFEAIKHSTLFSESQIMMIPEHTEPMSMPDSKTITKTSMMPEDVLPTNIRL